MHSQTGVRKLLILMDLTETLSDQSVPRENKIVKTAK
jgi:hypothetical protein